MSNNTSKYQEYTFKELLDQYDRILIPMIQRDYAQGRTDKKATDVRNNLLTGIFSDKNVHFDLVFGSKEKRIIDGKEMNCFIPVDGQQRLTTLFLLHLYGQKEGKTNTVLNLSKFSYDTRRAASDFCKSITSEEWVVPNDKNVSDVIKDSSWFMNYWEKDPTVEGMLNMLDAIQEKCEGTTVYPDLSKVKFYFFDLESNGLNENLYLKMNSRGKPLTAFENLKAKMEKVLPEDVKIDDKCFPVCDALPKGSSFKAKWKYFMDRNWTETFWDKEHPEKYDESITKFIVRFLAGYWAAYGTDEEQMANDLKSLNSKDSYSDFIPFEPIKKVLDLEHAFSTLAYALTTVPEIKRYWPKDEIKVSDKSEYKFLAIVFTCVLFNGDRNAMRFAWNMSENYITGYETFVAYCERAKEIRDRGNAIYIILSDSVFTNPSDQLKEEIAKAKQILSGSPRSDGKSWEDLIIAAEKYAFFKGAIRCLFTDRDGKNNDWDHFDEKWEKARFYFDSKGVKDEYKVQLTKSLVVQCDNWNEQLYDKQIFNPNANTWKWILTSKNWRGPVHHILMGDKINPTTENNDKNVKEFVTPILNDLPFDFIINNEPDGRFRWLGPRLCFYKPYGRDMATFDWENWHRNKILSSLLRSKSITTKAQMGESDFFWGWNINFNYEYKGSGYSFQWWGRPNEKERDVYLMEDDWSFKERDKDNRTTDKGTDEDNYFCFRVKDDASIEDFIKSLNDLIEMANKGQQGSLTTNTLETVKL